MEVRIKSGSRLSFLTGLDSRKENGPRQGPLNLLDGKNGKKLVTLLPLMII